MEKSVDEFYNKKDAKDGKSLFCKACESKRSKEYYKSNQEKIKQSVREYAASNPEKLKQQNANYYIKNKEKLIERRRPYKALYSKENKQKIAA